MTECFKRSREILLLHGRTIILLKGHERVRPDSPMKDVAKPRDIPVGLEHSMTACLSPEPLFTFHVRYLYPFPFQHLFSLFTLKTPTVPIWGPGGIPITQHGRRL